MDEMALQIVPHRCGALTSSGTPCRRFAIYGGTRCSFHGGGTPAARRYAQEMLAVARVPAARVLLSIVEDFLADPCAVCGRPSGDPTPVIRAAVAVLDRTGFSSSLTLKVDAPAERDPWLAWLTAEQLCQVAEITADAERRWRAGEPRQDTLPAVNVFDIVTVKVDGSTENESIPQADATPEPVDATVEGAKALDTQGVRR